MVGAEQILKELNTLRIEVNNLRNCIESTNLREFNVEQAAAYLDRNVKTIYNLTNSGKLKGFKRGKKRYFKKHELDAVYANM